MYKHSELREYIIKYFIITIVCVSLVENIISYVMNQWVFPVVEILQQNGQGASKITLGEVLLFLIFVAGRGILGLVENVMPGPAKDFIESLSMRLQMLAQEKYPRISEGIFGPNSGVSRIAQYIIAMAIVILIYLLPYIIGILFFSRTVMKKVRQMEEKQEQEKEEFDRKRNLMLSDIAHDLRTPMTTISGYSKAINDGMITDPDKQKEYFDVIQLKAKKMNDLVELLFEYVKIDSEGFALSKEECDIVELLRENAAVMYSDIEEAGMTFDVDLPERRIDLNVDKLQFSRVITNLLVNAIRHNNEGTQISLSLKEYPGMILIDVADNGSEIPKEVAKYIFDPFAKVDKSRRNSGGSGLGLSIAKKVVNMHGWELSLNTKINGYTKAFEIRIPNLQ